ncbi:MAG TPA: Hpt domain-containing protein [Gammaproteobacteria bacterium]|nr:Hpt domain-containing protein [Gammaproteobacteria bacterium]
MAVGTLDDLAAHSFDLVNRELSSTLDHARRELEEYVDGNADRDALVRTADLLHLARGALKIVEIHGAALLAEEMEQTCRRLAEPGEHARDEQGLEALTRAMVQLPAYLERLLGGGKDVSLVLLPLLNDLRQARDKPSLSEGTLVLLAAGPFERHAESQADAQVPDAGPGFEKVAQRLRPAFQSALLGWIKGNDVGKHLDELLRVSIGLERAAASDQVKQLWTVIVAVLTAIRAGGLEATVTLKRLLGQADRQLKRLIDGGEPSIVNAPPVDLINSLLYYVARSTTDDTRINKLRDLYGLSDMLPAEEQLEQAREGLAGPSIKLMRTVAHAIKEDLGAVKDVLDIFVRTGMQDMEKLGPQLELLKKIGDTLGVLGLEKARAQIQRETQELGGIVASNKTVDRAVLEKVAATLLEVEDALDRELVSAVLPVDRESPAGEAAPDTQQRHVTQAVMGECIVNLAKIKEAVIQLVDQPGDARALDQVKPQLRGIVAGLLMLDKTKALQVVERIGAVIATRLAPSGATFKPEHLERLADSIVSVEYYMETVSAGRSDPWYMLENAERCLDLLEKLPVVKTAARPTPASEPVREPPKPAPKPAAKPPSVMEVDQDRSDPELVELFIEEAKEEVGNIGRQLPMWTADLRNSEALIAVRRSFHTLKGSGRMVGAQLIGEYAWSIENLLNRLINQTVEPTPGMVEFVATAASALPELIEQLEVGLPPKTDVHLLMKQAEAFAEGDAAAGSLTSQSLRMPAPPAPVAETEPPPMDPVLADIFVKEMRGHVKVVREFLERAAQRGEPHLVDEPLYRACHTLLGSGRMAGFEPAIALAGPLAEHLRRHFDAGTGITSAGVEALRAAAVEIERMADALVVGRDYSLSSSMPAALAALADAAAQPTAPPAAAVPARPTAPPSAAAAPPAASPPLAAAPQAPAMQPAPRAERLAAAAAEPAADEVYDAEIAAIFAEEAAELLDNAEVALRSLRQEPASNATVELQRLLHTLKGGARMAGIIAMGTLSHALETLLERIAGGHVEPAAATLDVVQRSLDELQLMRDAVAAASAVTPAGALVAEIERVAAPRAPAAPAPAVVAEPPAAAPAPTSVPSAPPAPGPAPPRSAPPTPTPVATRPAPAIEPAIDDSGAIELTAANLDELESIELPSTPSAETADAALDAGASDEPTVEEEIPEEPTVVEKFEAAAQPELEPPSEAGGAPPPVAQPAAPVAPDRRGAERAETARVDAGLLDVLLNGAGEINIFQSRLTQQLQSIDFHLGELGTTVSRLRDQLRKLEAETEAQILHRHQDDVAGETGFDPLELDRYSTIQQLSRALAESANDVASINELLGGLTNETETLLTQQARVTSELQNGLMQTRMVPFQRHVARLARIVRQAAADTGKSAELFVEGENNEIDRQVLESMLPPFEHLLRNAVAHGIEAPAVRKQRGKPDAGRVTLKVKREGTEVLIEVADDGGGLDLAAIRRKALEKGLLGDGQKITDDQAIELILQPGFSTAGELTQTAGRGVGMDVVDNEVKKLGGSMRIESTAGQGTRFLIRLPYTLAITHALIVNVGEETFALPLPTVEGITRLSREKILKRLTEDEPKLDYGGITYRIQHLGSLVGGAPSALPDEENSVSLVLIRAGEASTALLTDSLEGSREIVVKTLGPHIANVAGVTGATILGDGRVIMILDPGTLVRAHRGPEPVVPVAPEPVERPLTALVVDDSITMRRVTQRLLERRGAKVLTARDGLDAITVLQEHEVDIILLDIEMPRMDGYQFATHVRNDPRLKDVPIIMITSRSGEKHRAKAIEIGVNDYLSKPYQEGQLVAAIEALLGRPL